MWAAPRARYLAWDTSGVASRLHARVHNACLPGRWSRGKGPTRHEFFRDHASDRLTRHTPHKRVPLIELEFSHPDFPFTHSRVQGIFHTVAVSPFSRCVTNWATVALSAFAGRSRVSMAGAGMLSSRCDRQTRRIESRDAVLSGALAASNGAGLAVVSFRRLVCA